MKMLDTLTSTHVHIVGGTGGVGKTTMSCATGLALAHERNARVLVLTIDPAKRLAAVLSEESLGHEPKEIDHTRFIPSARGTVHAAMVDAQEGWKQLINRYARSETDAQRIFDNALFENLTTRFAHSHDFIAMDQLFEYYHSGKYDYIVLDTPPSSQAFGFFDAPYSVSEFFGGRMVRLVTSPYRVGKGRAAKIFDVASQPFFALADKVLGRQFLNDIGEFFFLFHTMYDDIVDRAQKITEFLTSPRVNALLVASPQQLLSKSYVDTVHQFVERKIAVGNVITNNIPYRFPLEEIEDYLARCSHDALDEILSHEYKLSEETYRELSRAHRRFESSYSALYRVPAPTERERMSSLVELVQNIGVIDDTI